MMTLIATLALLQAAPADYADAMKKAAAKFSGKEGVVLHLGDSITYANQYGGWARGGKGKTPQEEAALKWMHCNDNNESDGWFLARVDRPGNRSDTAVSGIRSYEFLEGGKSGIPPMAEVVKKYNPQIAVVLLGTNDANGGRSAAQYKGDMTKVVDLLLANGTIPIVTTIPPIKGKDDLVKAFNAALLDLVKEKKIPVIDYYAEIVKRRPTDWMGTLISDDGVHPTGDHGGASPSSEPTEENLKNSGYLLRGVLSVRKIAEVKAKVLDGAKKK
ncbi:MAG: SGNH/GDSL hydrolase family protein [Planctomycetaceae bacterium]|nr:SGNH/GDSL hydrolase family protein [Planctomycetaceae bacterium]